MSRGPSALTTRGRAFLAAGVALVLAGLGLGFVDVTRAGVLLLCLPAAGSLITRRRPTGVVVERRTDPVRVSAGDPATVTLALANPSGSVPALLLAEEQLPDVLGDPPRFLLGAVPEKDRRSVRYTVRPELRGRYSLGPLSAALEDPFGMTRRFTDLGGTTPLLVLPRVRRLPGGRLPGTGLGTEGEVPHMVALHGEDDQSIREYRDGDDLRRVHWPATARTGELMVRQEDHPARRRAVVLLDSRAEGHHGADADSSFEWAVGAAASVGVHFAGLGYAVHLVTAETARGTRADLPCDADVLLDLLADAATGPASSFADAVRAAGDLTGAGGHLVAVLTPVDEAALRAVAALRQPAGTALAFLLDPGAGRARRAEGSATAARDLLQGAGWTTVVVTPRTDVAAAWAAAQGRARGEHRGSVPA